MAGLPRIIINFSNGNLLRDIAAIDGLGGLMGTVETVALIGVHNIVYNLKDAETKGYTEDAEPTFHRQLKEFYAEISGNQRLHIMGVEETMTMTQMLDKDDPNGAGKLLLAAKGEPRLLGVFRKPDAGYDPGNAFYDGDVESALAKTIPFCQDQNGKYNYLGILVEGRIANEDSNDRLVPKEVETDFGGLVVGGSKADGSASVGTVLGRAVKYPAHIKVGKVANGAIQINEAYIGTKKITEYPGLDALHDSGVISFMTHPRKAGIYIGIDRMANTGDYRRLVYRRLIDKAAMIAVATYVEYIQDEIDVTPEGLIDGHEAMNIESTVVAQLESGMKDQVSPNGFESYVNPDQDIINSETLAVQIRVRPKGYVSFFNVDLGLTA